MLGGGGNTLVVEDCGDTLVVDTKFPPGSLLLRRWLDRNGIAPPTKVINTHYHYDHCRGNALFPGPEYITHYLTRQAMDDVNASWWSRHRKVEPTVLVEGTRSEMDVGAQKIEFLIRPEGISVGGIIEVLGRLAHDYPDAIFMPGHGPIARAVDLLRHVAYLEDLMQQVATARALGKSASGSVRQVDLARWDLDILPVTFHGLSIQWATAASNVRWMHRLLEMHR